MEKESKKSPFWSIMFAVFFGSFLSILSSGTISVVLPVIVNQFRVDLNIAQWTVTGFMLATGIIAPIAGFLGDKLSYKYLYVYSLIGFTVASGLCSLAWNIQALITFRIIQGLFCGIIMPTTMAIIYQVIEKEKQAFALSLWSVSAMFAPAIGPTVGGWITDTLGWESIFLLNIPIGITAIIIAARFIPYYRLTQVKSFDLLGFVTVIISSSSILVVFSQIQTWGWFGWKTITLCLVGIISLAVFIKHELSIKEPILNLSVFRYSRFTYGVILNGIIALSLYSSSFLIPVFLQNVQHNTAMQTGLVMLPGALTMIVAGLIVGKIYGKVGPMWLSLAGVLFSGIATWRLSSLSVAVPLGYVVLWMAVRGIGNGLCYMPINNVALSAIPKEYSGHGSAINNWIRQAMGSFSIGVFSSIFEARTVLYFKELSQSHSGNTTFLKQQAMCLSMDDVLFMAAIVIIITIPLTILLKKQKNIDLHIPKVS